MNLAEGTPVEVHARFCTERSPGDPLGKHLDVLGCNEYIGWYDGPANKPDTTSFKSIYDKPLIMSEFGAEAPTAATATKTRPDGGCSVWLRPVKPGAVFAVELTQRG